MARQFPNVSGRNGAPMGRHTVGDLDKTRRSVRLFAVNLDSGGYDDGGAYWGWRQPGERLWCAIDRDGDMQFTDAATREQACFLLDIPFTALKSPLNRPGEYVGALIDGRAPMPKGKDRADVFAWAHDSGCAVGGATR